jgi:hypothetical protein
MTSLGRIESERRRDRQFALLPLLTVRWFEAEISEVEGFRAVQERLC